MCRSDMTIYGNNVHLLLLVTLLGVLSEGCAVQPTNESGPASRGMELVEVISATSPEDVEIHEEMVTDSSGSVVFASSKLQSDVEFSVADEDDTPLEGMVVRSTFVAHAFFVVVEDPTGEYAPAVVIDSPLFVAAEPRVGKIQQLAAESDTGGVFFAAGGALKYLVTLFAAATDPGGFGQRYQEHQFFGRYEYQCAVSTGDVEVYISTYSDAFEEVWFRSVDSRLTPLLGLARGVGGGIVEVNSVGTQIVTSAPGAVVGALEAVMAGHREKLRRDDISSDTEVVLVHRQVATRLPGLQHSELQDLYWIIVPDVGVSAQAVATSECQAMGHFADAEISGLGEGDIRGFVNVEPNSGVPGDDAELTISFSRGRAQVESFEVYYSSERYPDDWVRINQFTYPIVRNGDTWHADIVRLVFHRERGILRFYTINASGERIAAGDVVMNGGLVSDDDGENGGDGIGDDGDNSDDNGDADGEDGTADGEDGSTDEEDGDVDGQGSDDDRPARTPTGETLTLDLGGGVTMELVRIPGGTFMMGSDHYHFPWEMPVHSVTISRDFYIGRFEVTQAQWEAVMGDNPSYFDGCDNCPVESVSWDDVVEFCETLSSMTGYDIRLPTEAEWEYACRAGTTTEYSFGDDRNDVGDYGWYRDNSSDQSHEVGGKLPNAWGLYDMGGNVREFCKDNWHNNYNGAPSDGSAWTGSAFRHVSRGGSRQSYDYELRSAERSGGGSPWSGGGFRVAAGT